MQQNERGGAAQVPVSSGPLCKAITVAVTEATIGSLHASPNSKARGAFYTDEKAADFLVA